MLHVFDILCNMDTAGDEKRKKEKRRQHDKPPSLMPISVILLYE